MLVGAVMLAASSLLYEPAQSVPLVMAVRVFHGIGWGGVRHRGERAGRGPRPALPPRRGDGVSSAWA